MLTLLHMYFSVYFIMCENQRGNQEWGGGGTSYIKTHTDVLLEWVDFFSFIRFTHISMVGII